MGAVVFIATWIYCIAEYGFLFGVGLGWLPAFILGILAFWIWPVFIIGGIIFLIYAYNTGILF